MLIVFTGNGKGKTTAAIGQAVRAVGNGSKVLMVQLIKGPWKSGEDTSVKKFNPDFIIVKKGKGFVHIGDDTVPFEEHRKAALDALVYAQEQIDQKKWNILILDEIWNALSLKLVSEGSIADFISKNVGQLDHLIMTGRDCPQKFIDKADLVTEMKEIKHPFTRGLKGSKGVEF
ncbi:MAG TPA: cob(I)yrinic acid a,c-diamide adenosyltransferase [Candidatus Paceibacterota bacterium]